MILRSGVQFEKFRHFIILGSCSKILKAASLQIITEQCKGVELLLLSFELVEILKGSC